MHELFNRTFLGAAAFGAALASTCASAEIRVGQVNMPAGPSTSYVLSLPVEHPGRLVVEADWEGSRVVAFRLEGPTASAPVVRRAGPSPQRLAVEVEPQHADAEKPWKLSLRSAPGRQPVEASLTVRLPGPRVETAVPQSPRPDVSSETPPAPWTLEKEAPPGLAPERAALFATTERFRALVVDQGGGQPWHDDLLRYLVRHRDDPASGGAAPEEATRKMLRDLAVAVREIDALRASDDPILSGPSPETPSRAWLSLRRERLEPLRRSLDALLEKLQLGYARELQEERWPVRFVGHLAAWERRYEASGRPGADEPVEAQWERILAAAAALESLAGLPAP